MIYNISGTITYVGDQFLVVECSGIGFKCFSSLNTLKSVGRTGEKINLFTYLSVKEDALALFGFATEEELSFFKLLITVSGVGPKAAVAVLSELEPSRLALAIASGDVKSITRANGVGKKTAERIVLELKDKVANVASSNDMQSVASAAAVVEESAAGEAVAALVALGFNKSDAAVVVGAMDKSLPADEMIRLGLRQLSSNL